MVLYEERLTSRTFQILMLVPIISMFSGLYATYKAGEGVEIMLAATLGVAVLLLDAMAVKIEIDEREVRVRGLIGLLIRKTVRIENIASFSVSEGWMGCSGAFHFNLPARGCVVLRRKKGWTVSFTTNHPEEIARVLAMLGVPREP